MVILDNLEEHLFLKQLKMVLKAVEEGFLQMYSG